jgi:hypothetical protein
MRQTGGGVRGHTSSAVALVLVLAWPWASCADCGEEDVAAVMPRVPIAELDLNALEI